MGWLNKPIDTALIVAVLVVGTYWSTKCLYATPEILHVKYTIEVSAEERTALETLKNFRKSIKDAEPILFSAGLNKLWLKNIYSELDLCSHCIQKNVVEKATQELWSKE